MGPISPRFGPPPIPKFMCPLAPDPLPRFNTAMNSADYLMNGAGLDKEADLASMGHAIGQGFSTAGKALGQAVHPELMHSVAREAINYHLAPPGSDFNDAYEFARGPAAGYLMNQAVAKGNAAVQGMKGMAQRVGTAAKGIVQPFIPTPAFRQRLATTLSQR